jgi:hypothetical protein
MGCNSWRRNGTGEIARRQVCTTYLGEVNFSMPSALVPATLANLSFLVTKLLTPPNGSPPAGREGVPCQAAKAERVKRLKKGRRISFGRDYPGAEADGGLGVQAKPIGWKSFPNRLSPLTLAWEADLGRNVVIRGKLRPPLS